MIKENEILKTKIIYNKLIKDVLSIEDLKLITGTSNPEIIFNLLFLSISFNIEKIENDKKFDYLFWNNFFETIKLLMSQYPSIITNKKKEELKENKSEIMKILSNCIDTKEIADISLLFKNIITIMNKEIKQSDEKKQYKILDSIIFELKNMLYLKQILNRYPNYVNVKDSSNNSIIIKVVDYLCGTLKYNGKIEDALFYSNVLKEFFLQRELKISIEQLKQCYFKIKENIQYLSIYDEKYNQKISICESMLNLLDEKKLSYKNIKYIFQKYDIKQNFSEEVKDEVKKIVELPTIIVPNDNFQNSIVAIDSEDTLDRDDAATVIKCHDYYEVKVFISDVARFIPIGSAIDKEAFKRTETIYLPDRTINELEPQLSNKVLSLNKNGYKNVVEYSFKIYFDGSIVDFKIKPNIVKMDHCINYNQANIIIDKGNYDPLSKTLINLSEACSLIRSKNPKKNLYTEIEYLIKCYDKNLGIELCDGKITSQIIIMELMTTIGHLTPLLFSQKGYPFLYRNLLPFYLTENYKDVRNLELKIANRNTDTIEANKIIEILKKLCPRAYYSPNNEGHVGLNYTHYAHVGSPIRRYSDLTDQRLEYDYMFTKPSLEKDRYWEKRLPEIAEHCNNQANSINEFYKEYCLVKSL